MTLYATPSSAPWSPLENRALNIVVLLAGQALAFWAMRYLSFEPMVRNEATPLRRRHDRLDAHGPR